MTGKDRERFEGAGNVDYLEFDFSKQALPGKFDLIISGLAIRTVGRRSRGGPPAVADAEEASLQPAGGEAGSAAIWKGEKWT